MVDDFYDSDLEAELEAYEAQIDARPRASQNMLQHVQAPPTASTRIHADRMHEEREDTWGKSRGLVSRLIQALKRLNDEGHSDNSALGDQLCDVLEACGLIQTRGRSSGLERVLHELEWVAAQPNARSEAVLPLLEIGRLFERHTRFNLALWCYRAANASNPRDKRPYELAAGLCRRLGDEQSALELEEELERRC